MRNAVSKSARALHFSSKSLAGTTFAVMPPADVFVIVGMGCEDAAAAGSAGVVEFSAGVYGGGGGTATACPGDGGRRVAGEGDLLLGVLEEERDRPRVFSIEAVILNLFAEGEAGCC
jgi:hypothetical protein